MSWIPDVTVAVAADAALKATILLILALAVDGLLTRSSASVRHVLWSATVTALLAVPVLSAALPSYRVPVLPAPPGAEGPPAAPSAAPSLTTATEPAGRPAQAGEPARRGDVGSTPPVAELHMLAGVDGGAVWWRPVPEGVPAADAGRRGTSATGIRQFEPEPVERTASEWSDWLAVAWVAGALLVLLGLAGERFQLARLARDARRVRDGRAAQASRRISEQIGLRRPPALYLTPRDIMPSTWGIFRPRVLLPATAETWPEARLRAVLGHELAHVRRRDCAVQTAASLACALYWYHPLAWLAAARLRSERELASDDEAVALGGGRSGYAAELLELARGTRPLTPALTATTLARPADLSRRLEALVDEGRSRRRLGWRQAVAASVTAALVAVPLTAVEPFDTGGASARTVSARPAVHLGMPESGRPPDGPRDGMRLSGSPASECWQPNVSHSLNVHVDEGGQDLTWRSSRCRGEIRIRGRITFTDDFTWIRSVSSGGLLRLEEEVGGLRRLAEFRPADGGGVVLTFRENDERQDPAAADRRWIRRQILTVLRQTGLGAERRVTWLLERGGPDEVLEEVGRMMADRAQALYLTELLRQARLEPDQLRRTLAAGDRVGSDGKHADVLVTAAGRYPELLAGPLAPSFLDAAAGVGSDSRHTWMLEEALRRGGPGLLRVALRSARRSVGSDSQMARFLEHVAERHPTALKREARDDFFEAVNTVGSDTQHVRMLTMILRGRPGDEAMLALALASARSGVGSDAAMARFLVEVVREHSGLIGPGPLAAAFESALRTVGSDHQAARVRRALERAKLSSS